MRWLLGAWLTPPRLHGAERAVSPRAQQAVLDPKEMQITLQPFLEKNTSLFMKELWDLVLSAAEQTGPYAGIPKKFVDEEAPQSPCFPPLCAHARCS